MNTEEYVKYVMDEAVLKQRLATLAGMGQFNLADCTVQEVLREVERSGNDYTWTECGKFMHPIVQDAYLFLYKLDMKNDY